MEINMDERDPKDMNGHVRTAFEDVIAEPDGSHSRDCIWKCSYRCFNRGKGCCYWILTLICAVPLAFLWGCDFALITFSQIWCITPCFRCFQVNFSCFKRFWSTIVHCCYDPCYESAALFFSRINVTHNGGNENAVKPFV